MPIKIKVGKKAYAKATARQTKKTAKVLKKRKAKKKVAKKKIVISQKQPKGSLTYSAVKKMNEKDKFKAYLKMPVWWWVEKFGTKYSYTEHDFVKATASSKAYYKKQKATEGWEQWKRDRRTAKAYRKKRKKDLRGVELLFF